MNKRTFLCAMMVGQLVLAWAAERPGDPNDSALVADFGRPAALVIEGNTTFTREQILSGLSWRLDYQLARHPAAPLAAYIAQLDRAIAVGYEHAGFPKVMVRTVADAKARRLVVKVDEGPRYRCGEILLSGVTKMTNELVRQKISDAVGRSTVTHTIPLIGEVEDTDPDLIIWLRNRPVRFDEFSVQQLESLVRQALEELGYYQPKISVRLVPVPERQLADLRVEITEEGIRGTLQEIEVTGLRANNRKQVLEFLKLKPGMPWRGDLSSSISNQLWQSGRFYRQEIKVSPLAEVGDLRLELDLEELNAAPPLHQEFSPKAKALLKFREWLLGWETHQQDLVASMEITNALIRFHGHLALSLAGLAVAVRTGSSNEAPALQYGLVGSSDRTLGFYSCWSGERFVCSNPNHGFKTLIRVSPKTESAAAQGFDILVNSGIVTKKESRPLSLGMDLSPTAFVNLAAREGIQCDLRDGWLTLTTTNAEDNAWMETKVDEATGRLIQIASGDEVGYLRVRYEKGGYARLSNEVATAKSFQPNRYVAHHGLSSWLSFVAMDVMASPLTETLLKIVFTGEESKQLPPSVIKAFSKFNLIRAQALATLNPERLNRLFAPLDELIPENDDRENFVVTGNPSLTASQAANPIMTSIGAYVLILADQLLPENSWLWSAVREAGFNFAGQGRYTQTELDKLLKSEECGPVGCLATASLLGRVNPLQARAFAQRGLSRLTPTEFNKDYDLVLNTNAILGRVLSRSIRLLQELSQSQLAALTATLPESEAAFLQQLAGLMRQDKSQSTRDAGWPAFEQHWEKVVRPYLELGFRHFLPQVQFLTDSKALFERGQQLISEKGVLQEFAEAAQCFRKAADQGHAGAQLYLGILYERGDGVTQDFGQALRWYRQAAEQKEPHATCRIADLYRDGKGVPQDQNEAANWYRREAEGACAGAQFNLGAICEAQRKIPEALKWFRRAAEQGAPEAQSHLGEILSDGFTVPADYVEACQWLLLAVQGEKNMPLTVLLRRVKTKLTAEQLGEAQKRADAITKRLKDQASHTH